MKTMTATAIKNLKPKAAPYEVADTASRGLRLKVSPKGLKTWSYRYRDPETTKLVKIKLGNFPKTSLVEARDLWSELKDIRDNKLSPKLYRESQTRKRQEQQAVEKVEAEVSDFTVAKLIKIYISVLSGNGELAISSWKKTRGYLTNYVEPELGDRPAASITRFDIVDLLAELDPEKPSLPKSVQAAVSAMYKFAVEESANKKGPKHLHLNRDTPVTLNPAAGIKTASCKPRLRALSDAEVRKLFTGKDNPLSGSGRDAIELLWLTGCRASEVCGAHTSEIEGDVWTIPGTRTKNGKSHTVMLSTQAVALIKKQDIKKGFIFPNKNTDAGHLRRETLLNKMKAALPVLELENVRLHDCRNNLTNFLANNEHHIEIRDRLLNHSGSHGADASYNSATMNKTARKAWQAWADHLQVLTSSNVTKLKPKKRAS